MASSATKRSIYVFPDLSSTGLNLVPNGRIILVENIFETYVKKDNTNINENTTIGAAISLGNLVRFWTDRNDGPDSGLSAEYWGGHKLLAISVNEPTAGQGSDGDIWFQRDA